MANFNEMFEKGAKGIGDLASQVMSSQFFKNVVPTSEDFGKELSAMLQSNRKINAAAIQGALDKSIAETASVPLRKAGLDGDANKNVANQLANALHGTDYSDEALDKLAEIMKKNNIDDATFEKFKKFASQNIKQVFESQKTEVKPSVIEGVMHPLWYGKTYFNHPDKTIQKQRIAAVAGTYAGVSVGARLLAGGNLTHDEYGQRDIAGIPFL